MGQMAKGSKTKRERLFSLYSKNLSFYKPEYADHFLCPVCKCLFAHEDLNKLSLAHIIPESIGGRQLTLACSKCDNRIGHDFDIHLSREMLILSQQRRKEGIYGRLRVNGGKKYGIMFKGQLLNAGHCDMHIRPPHDVPPDIWKTRMDELTDINPKNVKISLNLFNPPRRNVSYIYSAFLLMFSKLGYEYVLSPNVDPIRQVLMGDYLSSKVYQLILDLQKPLAQWPIPSIYMLTQPAETRSFLICFPSANKGRMRCVFMPGFDISGAKGYENLSNIIGSQLTLDSKLEGFSLWNSIPDISSILFKDYGHFIWNGLIKKVDHPSTREVANKNFKLAWDVA